ncbi:MAG: hypothetical protein QME77_10660 [bacterium]|nr:hypothetical protein [bacterium]
MRGIHRRAASLLFSTMLMLGAVPAVLSSSLSLTEVRPPSVALGASIEATLVGSGFTDACRVWVRAAGPASLPEQSIAAVPRSATLMTVLVGGELTNRPRTLEFQVRCAIETGMDTRTVSSEWRPLDVRLRMPVGTPRGLTPWPPPELRDDVAEGRPAAASDVVVEIITYRLDPGTLRWTFRVRWRDNSNIEDGFYVSVAFRGHSPMVEVEVPRNATRADVVKRGFPELVCGREYSVLVRAFTRRHPVGYLANYTPLSEATGRFPCP